jgi:hypothetical protein
MLVGNGCAHLFEASSWLCVSMCIYVLDAARELSREDSACVAVTEEARQAGWVQLWPCPGFLLVLHWSPGDTTFSLSTPHNSRNHIHLSASTANN